MEMYRQILRIWEYMTQIGVGRIHMIAYKEFNAELIDEALGIYDRAGWNAYLGDKEKLIRAFQNSLYILGAFEGTRLVGFIRCVGDGEHIVYVQDLVVDLDYKRQGIGKTLLHKAMEEFKDVRMFTLITDANDEVDNAFYRANGMKTYTDCDLGGYLR